MNRAVSLSEAFLRALVDELAGKQTAAIILAGSHAQGDATPYVFTSLRGGPMTRRTVHHVVAEGAKAAGIEFPVHPHMLRHATGYYLANSGQDTRSSSSRL